MEAYLDWLMEAWSSIPEHHVESRSRENSIPHRFDKDWATFFCHHLELSSYWSVLLYGSGIKHQISRDRKRLRYWNELSRSAQVGHVRNSFQRSRQKRKWFDRVRLKCGPHRKERLAVRRNEKRSRSVIIPWVCLSNLASHWVTDGDRSYSFSWIMQARAESEWWDWLGGGALNKSDRDASVTLAVGHRGGRLREAGDDRGRDDVGDERIAEQLTLLRILHGTAVFRGDTLLVLRRGQFQLAHLALIHPLQPWNGRRVHTVFFFKISRKDERGFLGCITRAG